MNNNDANITIDGKKIEVTIGSLLYSDKVLINLEDGYEIKDENGQLYAVKKKEYPKTYEECCKVLGYNHLKNYVAGYKPNLLCAFQELLICRDAYWKIAGEELSLGKPWKPDWKNEDNWIHCITTDCGEIYCTGFKGGNKILAFPTEEMRDAFYENFKELIEQCKELL